MRKSTLALLCLLFTAFITSYSEAFSQQSDQLNSFILSGKIENIKPDENGIRTIELSFPKGSSKKSQLIFLKDDGSFTDTITGKEGRYFVSDGNFPYVLFLKPGGQYTIQYVANGPLLGEVKLGGSDTSINRYFVTKQKEKTFFNPGEEMLEATFRQYLGDWKTKEINRINRFNLPPDIASHESQSVYYEYLFNLYLFMRFSEMRDSNFAASETTKKELRINYDNEVDYKEYSDYRRLVAEYYIKQLDSINTASKQKDPLFSLEQNNIKLLATIIPNRYISNDNIAGTVIYSMKKVKDVESYYNDFLTFYTGDDEKIKEQAQDAYLRLTKLKKGTPSPQFSNYINYLGGTNSLQDYRGKYVFIDIWATWCLNCWNEFPYIKKLEEKYRDKNIVFLSISTDEDKDEWKKTIEEKKLPGIQLRVKSKGDTFMKEYAVYGIPRYILLDPQGKIISYNTPRPSATEELEELFRKAGL